MALLLGFVATLAAPMRGAEASISDENQIKAVCLFHFAQFVDWPASSFAGPRSPVVIGVLGNDPFGTYLDDVVRNETIGRRPLVVRRFARLEDVRDCQILFVSGAEAAPAAQIFAALAGRPILTVGDSEHFTRQGGMVRFAVDQKKIRLRINPGAAKAANLTISSKLLRLATLVSTGKD